METFPEVFHPNKTSKLKQHCFFKLNEWDLIDSDIEKMNHLIDYTYIYM
jgi:hypothetical protein